jgi:aspartate racemase
MTGRGTIGILGGAGVAASAALVQRIVDIVTDRGARFDQDHPEVILLQATQAPSRSLWLEGRGPSFVPAYVDAAIRLREAGAGIVVMCCNTAHAARAEIAAAAGVTIPDLIALAVQEAAQEAAAPGDRRIGVLSSSGTRAAGLYRRAIEQLAPGSVLVEPDAAMQDAVTEAIVAVKRGRHRQPHLHPAPSELFARAADSLCRQGAQTIILGCTEIPLAFPSDWPGAPVVDTIDVLAQACLRWWAGEKDLQWHG